MAQAWSCGLAPRRRVSLRERDRILYPLGAGEPAGRAMEPDVVPIAIELARELKQPVQVTALAILKPEPRPGFAGRTGAHNCAAR